MSSVWMRSQSVSELEEVRLDPAFAAGTCKLRSFLGVKVLGFWYFFSIIINKLFRFLMKMKL